MQAPVHATVAAVLLVAMLLLFGHFSGITSGASFLSREAMLGAAASNIKMAIYSAVEELNTLRGGRAEVRKFISLGYPVSAELKQENGKWMLEVSAYGQVSRSPIAVLDGVRFQQSSSGGDYIIVYAKLEGGEVVVRLENL